MISEGPAETFKRHRLFDVRDANIEGIGFHTNLWATQYQEWAEEGLVIFNDGFWLTDVGHKFLSAL